MRVVAGVLLALVLVSGCGGGEESAPTSQAPVTEEPTTAARTPAPSATSDTGAAKRPTPKADRRPAAGKGASARGKAAKKASVRGKAAVRKAGSRKAGGKGARRFGVLNVVDGDTVTVDYRGGVSVRVIGIDTPETVSPSVPDECGGQEASREARRLLAGTSVAVRYDPTQSRVDRYGRPLVYLRVPGLGDYGRAMIRRGLATEYTYDAAYQRQRSYQNAQRFARRKNRGLWRTCGGSDKPLAKPGATRRPKQSGDRSHGRQCAPGYSPCVPSFPPDRDCDDVNGPVTVTEGDPHELDSDGDGVACES